MKVMVIMGTRPEVIKLAPVVAELQTKLAVIVCSTGQHREMLEQAISCFGIDPQIRLDCMRPGQSLNGLASRLLSELDTVLERECPDWVIVQGDTTTAFCAGLAAFHRGISIGHVEAGLRTGDLTSPFPEEANRSLLSRIATKHFAPTLGARANLLRDNVDENRIVVTGNTVVDAIERVRDGWRSALPQLPDPLQAEKPQILVTCHRRENFGAVLLGICQALQSLCGHYAQYRWVFPVHLNPEVRKPVMRELAGIDNLMLIDPVDYPSSLYLISRSALVISDSGGIQEEAPSFGVPVVVMRNHTERTEGVDAGFATLAGQRPEDIIAAASTWLDNPKRRMALSQQANPYGDGHASERVLAALLGKEMESFNG